MIKRNRFIVLFFFIGVSFSLVVPSEASGYSDSNKKLQKPTTRLPEDVKNFNAAFKREVKASKNLTKLFHIDDKISPAEFYAGKVYLNIALFREVNSNHSAFDALLLTSTIPSDQKRLKDDGLIAVYSNFVAKSLHKLNAFNGKNSNKLAKAYAMMMEKSYREVSNENYPRSKVAASNIAVLSFVKSQFDVTRDLQNTFLDAYRNEWKLQAQLGKFPDADKKLPPLKNPDENPLLKPDPKSCHVSKAVHQFHQFFQREVESSKTLSKLHELDDSVMFSKGVEYMNEFLLHKYDVQDAAILADFMSKYVDNEMSKKPSTLVSVSAKSMGKYLESDLILNCRNAKNLASRYARILEDNSEFIEINPRSKIASIVYGMFEYLRDLRALDVARGEKLAFFYGNEWKCLKSKN